MADCPHRPHRPDYPHCPDCPDFPDFPDGHRESSAFLHSAVCFDRVSRRVLRYCIATVYGCPITAAFRREFCCLMPCLRAAFCRVLRPCFRAMCCATALPPCMDAVLPPCVPLYSCRIIPCFAAVFPPCNVPLYCHRVSAVSPTCGLHAACGHVGRKTNRLTVNCL